MKYLILILMLLLILIELNVLYKTENSTMLEYQVLEEKGIYFEFSTTRGNEERIYNYDIKELRLYQNGMLLIILEENYDEDIDEIWINPTYFWWGD